MWEFTSIKNQVTQKATNDALMLLEAKFKEYTDKEEFDQLIERLNEYTLNTDFEQLHQQGLLD